MQSGAKTLLGGLFIGLASAAFVARLVIPADEAPLDLASKAAEIRAQFPEITHIGTDAVVRRVEGAGHTEIQLVDVREADEFAVSHIPGAVNLPSSSKQEVLLSAIRRDIPVVVYCSVGYRSARIVQRLQRAGRQNVVNYAGSLFDWANKGHPMQSAAGSTSSVHPYDAYWGRFLLRERRDGR
jgi:rhodanese-related sulfurtransferase